MAAPLDYVRPELFDEVVDRQHRSYVSAVLGYPLGAIRCRTTHTLLPIHLRWFPKYVIYFYYLFFFLQ
jgi:multisubunit Na+/H+ antiporter MnhE subunit